MGNCKNCRHWTAPATKYAHGHTCARTEGEDGKAKDAASLAWAEDGENYYAVLVTAPDFGCVQFEEKS